MNPIRRELLNGLLVLVVASLLSVAFSAFQVSFDAHLWVLILMGIAIALSAYITFEIGLGSIASAEDREKEWLKRVGTPARLVLGGTGRAASAVEAVKAMHHGSDLTVMVYATDAGGERQEFFSAVMEQLKRGTIREYKVLLCFDHDVLAGYPELKSGILRIGEGPGTISRLAGEHFRVMMETKGCSLYVAPVVFRNIVGFFGTDKVAVSLETADPNTGVRTFAGTMFFCDPPNGEIIEQLRQIERETERLMVAVRKIVFPEDVSTTVQLASR